MAVSDQESLNDIYSLAYEELRKLAGAVLRSDPGATLTPTTLVNEAWFKLAPSPQVANTTPLHFRRIAARAMRQVLIDAARRKHTDIRGGKMLHVSFDESLAVEAVPQNITALLALERALADLEQIAPRHAQLVEARFFGGLSWTECGEVLGVSEATVMRDWRAARAWLGGVMRQTAAAGSATARRP